MTKARPDSFDLRIYAAGLAGAAFLLLAAFLPVRETSLRKDMTEASRLMARAEAALLEGRTAKRIAFDEKSDPNRTGLIGLETSPITTSLGNLAAKRTTTNPNMAGLVVRLLAEARVRRGDAVAVGASSSFPALIVATLAAAKVLGARPLVISSLGASEWGANIPGWTWLDMEDCLRAAGILDIRPIALAVGGDEDVGRDMSPGGRELLAAKIKNSGARFIAQPDLAENVADRLRLYEEAAGGMPIRAFVNIGGSSANIGLDSAVLRVRPGLAGAISIPPPGRRGVLQEMAARKIPVVHLLNIRGLCERYGLPWDPVPLPVPGLAGRDRPAAEGGRVLTWLSAAYVLFVAAVLFSRKRHL